jgi:hypothetical protein
VDKKLPAQETVQVTVALPHKKTEVHIVKVQLESAFPRANPLTERQNDSNNGSSNSAAGAEKLKSESESSARHHHHQIQNDKKKISQKHHNHKHHHQKADNENEQAAGSSSDHGFAGMEHVSNEELRGDTAGDVFEPELDGMVSNQSYNEVLIEEEARQVSAAAMTQLADSSPFRLDTSKELVFAAAVAGAVVGVIGVLVATFGLHRHLVESTEHELESDLQDPEAGQVDGSNAQSQGISSAATGGSSVPALTRSTPRKEEESDVEGESVLTNA